MCVDQMEGVEVRILPLIREVLETNKDFKHLDCSFSECGNFANLGLPYVETMLVLADVIQECNIIPGCEVKFKGRHSLATEAPIKKNRKKKKKKIKTEKEPRLFSWED